MNNTLLSEVQEKNKFVASFMPEINSVQDHMQLFNSVDKAFASEEMANRVSIFNQKLSKYGLSYNPIGDKTKFANGCTECTTMTGIITRLCQSYGCVASEFVTRFVSDNCNDMLVENVTPINQTLIMGQATIQDISGTTADSNCVRIPLVPMTPFVTISRDALCSCTALDKMLLAVERMMESMRYAIDKALLYGKYDTATSAYVAIPNFDSQNLVMPTANKLTISSGGVTAVYAKIAEVVAKIQIATGCSADKIKILMNPGFKAMMSSGFDNNSRPIATEYLAMGINCENMKIACVDVTSCQSVNTTVNSGTGATTSDIFIGIPDHHIFGEFEFAPIDPMFDQTTLKGYKIVKDGKYGSKVIIPSSFYKVTATI
jgi:hypothetical protein